MIKSLGAITVPVPGTPVSLASVLALAPPNCHAILVQAIWSNTNRVWLGEVDMVVGTKTKLLICLPIPTSNVIASWSATVSYAQAAIPPQDIYVDAANAGEGVLVSAIIA